MINKITYSLLTLLFLSFCSCKESKIVKSEIKIPKSKIVNKKIDINNNDILRNLLLLQKDSIFLFSIKNKDSVLKFYEQNKGRAAWTYVKDRNDLYNSILKSYTHGLNPKDYNVSKIKSIVYDAPSELTNSALEDIFLTDNYLTLSYHLANGKIKPESIYRDWKLNKNIFNFNETLIKYLKKHKVSESFLIFSPNDSIYLGLQKQLSLLKNKIKLDTLGKMVTYGKKIKPENSDIRIPEIRRRLNELGFLNDSLVNNVKTHDSILQVSVKQFQVSKKIENDAIIGNETIKALNKNTKDHYLSILANLERLKWFPRNKGINNITVNIANYNLKHATTKDTTIYNVIVGKTTRKTPVFSSKVVYLDFNPKWFIPPTIKKEDIIPAASKDINYLKKKNISVYNDGKKMILDSIDWNTKEPLKYSYIQSSGNSNALGRVKIIFPNDFSVYLHDTPGKSTFKKNYRAKSSGCVRVENVFNLAGEILNETPEKIDSIINRRITKRIYVKDTINVHFLYWTVEFDKKNKPLFINDVYDLDVKLAEKLAY